MTESLSNSQSQMLPEMTPHQTLSFESLAKTKHIRIRPVALIVEDRLFSQKILANMLLGHCEVFSTAYCQEGWQKFIDIYPDIVFLDIELQDISGHALAKKIKRVAPETFVAMVTANHSEEDVNTAKVNRVNGFVVKPYSKAKIDQCLDKFNIFKKQYYASR